MAMGELVPEFVPFSPGLVPQRVANSPFRNTIEATSTMPLDYILYASEVTVPATSFPKPANGARVFVHQLL